MSKLPKDASLVRVDKKIYSNFKEYCREKGLVAQKHIGFILKDFMRSKDWTPENDVAPEEGS